MNVSRSREARDRRQAARSPGPAPHIMPSALQGITIGLIGAGTMGQALITGLLACGFPRHALRAAETDARRRTALRRRFRIAASADAALIARESDVVLLAVKPQHLAAVLGAIGPSLRRRQLVMSIAAGITLRWLEARLPGVPVIRIMPNLPATVGCGFSALALGRCATRRHRSMAVALFSAVGKTAELPERHFDAVTAVSGSGPAYVFFLVQMWETAARALGLPDAAASAAIRATLAGSVKLLRQSGEPAVSLIAQVASKGGTTEAALRVLASRRVGAHFTAALRAAARRSRALSTT